MKSMTCKQLGGACDEVFRAETFEEMANLSKAHSVKMFDAKDVPHLEAKETMMSLMKTPNAMQEWFMNKKAEFEALPHD